MVRREGPRALRQRDHRPRRGAVRRDRTGRRRASSTCASPGDAQRTRHLRAAGRARPAPEPRARAELRRRPEHGASHRPARRGGSRAIAWSRSAPGSARSRSRSSRPAPMSPRSKSTEGWSRCCATSSSPSGVRVIEADALKVDWPSILGSDRWILVANLPYNVATPLIADLLDGVPQISRMLVMVQREVGERLAASVGDEALRGGLGEDRVLGSRRDRRVGCRRQCSFRSPRSSPRSCASFAATSPAVGSDVDPDWLFTARAGRVRSSPQDASGIARRSRDGRADRGGRYRPDRARRGARHRRVGSTRPRGCTSWMRSSRRPS